jgi:hypothetical protein
MTTELLAVLLTTAWQTVGLVVLGVLIHRQGAALGTAIMRLGERVSPGEAAIILQQQRLMTRFEDIRSQPERER